MTQEEALNFMESTGMSKEQIGAIVGALEPDSEKSYTKLFETLDFNWVINYEHDNDKLADKIERCKNALTTLHNLGFNLCTGEVKE